MVIWARWGILGLLIPVVLIAIATGGAETVAKRMRSEDQKLAKKAPADDNTDWDSEEAEAAERKRAEDARKQAVEQDKATKRAKGAGYLIGGVASAAVLWPLGRRMNGKGGSNDQQSWEAAEAPVGGHTMFFIPLEYWGFIWGVIGLFKFLGST